ncbi:MAG: FCD domain-containing protein [Jiangellaceae bacterium]
MSISPGPRESVVKTFERARAPKTAEIIATSIRKQIVSRELEEGDTLPSEFELMQQFGVSRPTLREAFRILETESLISIRRGSRGGAQVMAPSMSVAGRYVGMLLQMAGTTIGEVYEARAFIEPVAARLLSKTHTDGDITDLQAIVDEMGRLGGEIASGVSSASTAWARLSWQFHEIIVTRSGNRAIAIQWAVLRDVTETHMASEVARTWDLPETRETQRKTVRSYSKLVRFIEAGDSAGAENHWRRHMQVSGKILAGAAQTKTIVDLFA